MPRGRWTKKDERMYKRILVSCKKKRGKATCERIAAATVNKHVTKQCRLGKRTKGCGARLRGLLPKANRVRARESREGGQRRARYRGTDTVTGYGWRWGFIEGTGYRTLRAAKRGAMQYQKLQKGSSNEVRGFYSLFSYPTKSYLLRDE